MGEDVDKQLVSELLQLCQKRWVSDTTGDNVVEKLEYLILNAIPEEYALATGYHFVSTLRPRGLFMRCSSDGFDAKLVYDYNVVVEVVASNNTVKSVRVRTIEDLIPCC
jgi:hypothetical protein